jgi:hypothetical protein
MQSFKQYIVEKLAETLAPELWERDNTLKPEIKHKLDMIADEFIEHLKLPHGSIEDIIITGSAANYNYHKGSDIDLHIEINLDKLGNTGGIDPLEYFVAKKSVWNDQHDIEIKGFPVELYAEPSNVEHTKNAGIYSIVKNKWRQKPSHFEPEVDEDVIQKTANEYKQKIDNLIKSGNTNKKDIDTIRQSIKNMRVSGLKGEKGEYSVGNLAFKELRNSGYMEKLTNYARKTLDKTLSLN